ncbi:MAG: acyltransferase [Candidatus Altiarchaeota archaeon]
MSVKKFFMEILTRFFSYLPSGIKLWVYAQRGSTIGKNVFLGFGSIIIPADMDFTQINLADNAYINEGVHIYAKKFAMGKNAEIKRNTRIWGQSMFEMKDDSYIDQDVLIDLRRNVSLGVASGIGARSILYTHGVWHSVLTGAPHQFAPITIKDRVWIAANVFVMPGTTIGEDAIVAACSVVTREVNEGSVVAGNPAKEISRTSKLTKVLGVGEQNKLVQMMLSDFSEIYEKTAQITEKKDDSMKIELNLKNSTYNIYYIMRLESFDQLMDATSIKSNPKKCVLVYLLVNKGLETNMARAGVGLINLVENEIINPNPATAELEKVFGNYGLRLKYNRIYS